MKKSNVMQYKLLSILLVICLLLGSVTFGTTASDDALQNTKSGSAVDTSLKNHLPLTLDDSFYHIYWTGLTGTEKTAAKGHIAEGVGLDSSNALRLGAEGIDFTYYETSLKFHKTGCLENSTQYVVSMMLKVDSGSITQVKLGMMDNSNAGLNYVKVLSSDELSSIAQGWTLVEFEYTPVNNVANQWSSVSFNLKSGAEGGSLLIDNLTVYKKSDTTKANLFTRGSFDGNVRYGAFAETQPVEANYLPVTVPSTKEFPNIYWHGLSVDNAAAAQVRLAENEGVNGTHGARIGATGFEISYYETTFKFPATGLLEADTKYIISVKLKKDAGTITALNVGMLDNNNSAIIYDCNIDGKYITDGWTTFEWEYTPTYEVAGQWSNVAFKLKTGADGGIVLIDDILVCKADDSSRRNIFYKGSFDTTVTMDSAEETNGIPSEYLPLYVSGNLTHIYWTDLTGDNKTAAQPRSESGAGFNATAGMKLGAENIVTGYYETSIKFPKLGALEADTKYIVEFKAKKDTGNVTNLKVGMFDNGNDAKAVYSCELSGEYLTDGWSLYTFEYTPTYKVEAQWSSIAFNIKTDSTGGSMLIDDVVVYKADDTQKTNIFTYGTFDTAVIKNKVEETNTTPSDNLPLDLSGGATHIYWTDLKGDNLTAAQPRTEAGIGFNATAGMKIGAESVPTSYYEASIKFPQLSSLKADTEYVISFKAKKDTGSVTNFKVGVFDNGDDAKSIYPCDLAGVYIDDTWSEFTFKYTPNYKVEDQWSSIAFNIVTDSTLGGSLIIDDVTVYEALDTTKTNIFTDGTFDTDCKGYDVTETPTTEKIVPLEIFDYTDKTSSQSGAVPRYYWNDDYRNEIRPQSVSGGVNGTYALQLGGAYGPINYYGVGFYHTNRGTWDNNTEYEVSVKVKKIQGSVTYFKMGYGDPETHTVLSISDSYLSNEWIEFVWRFTTGDNANDPKSDNLINLAFAALEGGATILIDDLKIYRADDPQKTDIFYKGSFDYVDKGQEPVEWDTEVAENTKPVFSTDYNKDYNVTDEQKAEGDTGVTARVVNCDTPSGDYCLALGFDPDRGTNNEVYITLASTRSGGKYKIGFWVKVVGDVYNAQVGMVEGDYSFESCGDGYTFNQYEHGKWTYHEFEVADTGTFMTNKSYRRFCVRLYAPAGSGMLIDGVTVKDADHPDPLDYMYYGDFEKTTEIPQIDWKKDERFIYKEEEK